MFEADFAGATPWYIAGQILGFALVFLSFFIYYGKSRRQILLTKLTSDVLNVIQQSLIGAPTGALINGIAVFRELIFYQRGKRKWADSILWLFVFMALMGISPLLTWSGVISLLPAAGSMIAVVAFYVKNPTHTRIFGLFAQILWLAYTVFTVNLGAVLQNVILIVSAVLGLIRDYREYRRGKATDGAVSST